MKTGGGVKGTENEHGIGKSAKNGQKEASDNTGTENLQQKLTSRGQIRSRQVHKITIS